MNYKESKYNFWVQYNNGFIVYNMISGAIGKIEREVKIRLDEMKISDQEKDTLIKKGIIIPQDIDETELINKDRINGIKREGFKNFRIWPTSVCNARCYYCFEKGITQTSMTLEVAEQAICFIDKIVERGDHIHIEWFGGEPLLGEDIIDYITERLEIIFKEKECDVVFSMISNGSRINEKLADKIKNKWKLKSIQITLDGERNDYEIIKSYNNPEKDNFDAVIKGLHLLLKQDVQVSVRLNYDTRNFDSLKKLIEYLDREFGRYKNIKCYVYPLWSSLIENDNMFVSNSIADEQYLELLKMIVNNNMNDIRRVARLGYRKYQCHACQKNGYSIFPDGKLGKCDEVFNQTVGDVWRGVTARDTYNYWIQEELEEECCNCSYLPVCQGGCRSYKFTNMPKCFVHKDILPKILCWYIDYLDQVKNQKITLK